MTKLDFYSDGFINKFFNISAHLLEHIDDIKRKHIELNV